MQTHLERAGYDVIAADAVPSGLHILRLEAPDLLITALRVEGINGLQLVAMSPKPTPAIVISDLSDRVLEREARDMGAEFLMKPVHPAVLLAAVQTKLSTVGASMPLARPRRWPRKRVGMQAQIKQLPARIVEVGYGGMCFEVESADTPPIALSTHFTLSTPRISVDGDVVWTNARGVSCWIFGATVSEASQAAWRQFVDTIP